MPQLSKESAKVIVVDFVRKHKNTNKVDVAMIEAKDDGGFIVRGTCPISLEGHPWAEKFEVVVDAKGKIRSAFANLL